MQAPSCRKWWDSKCALCDHKKDGPILFSSKNTLIRLLPLGIDGNGQTKKNLVLTRAWLFSPKQIICFKIRLKSRQKWDHFAVVKHKTRLWAKWEVFAFSLDSMWGVHRACIPKVQEKMVIYLISQNCNKYLFDTEHWFTCSFERRVGKEFDGDGSSQS